MSTPPARAGSPRAYLASLEQFGIKLGLETIRLLCGRLGDPQHASRAIHIAGTNGKGSVAAFTDGALRAAGHRVGRYTSPHLIRLEERFTVDGRPVGAEALDAILEDVRRAVHELQETGRLDVHPTYFEVTTAAAFLLFAREDVDVTVLEVGLGGRFDATNIVTPLVSAITSIAFDHEQHLGTTLADIAREKAGIIKPDVPVVAGDLPGEARHVVTAVCRERQAPFIDAVAGCRTQVSSAHGATVLNLSTPLRDYGSVTLSLRGDHQAQNAIIATRVLETADERGLAASTSAVKTGLETADWPGRLDLRALPDGRRVLIDGAHNTAGAEALARYLRREWPGGLPLVFGAMRDKDLHGMLSALAPLARPLLLTQAPGRRAATVGELAEAARQAGVDGPVLEPEITTALERAWSMGQTIAAAGSLYLAGAVLARVEGY